METNQNSKKIFTKADLLTGLLCLLGMVPGLVCYNRMPAQVPIHFNIHNQPDDYASKNFVIFVMPLLMILLHLICCGAENVSDSSKSNPKQVKWLVRLIIPTITMVLECITVMFVLEKLTDIGLICISMIGVLMILLGNYMPKTRPNLVFGIKLPWTVTNEEVWHKTHRLAGWLMVLGGIITIAVAFLNAYLVCIFVITIVIMIPIIYSYIISKKVVSE